MSEAEDTRPQALDALVPGALAGLSVELVLYPLDTLKTRLQSPTGFDASGGALTYALLFEAGGVVGAEQMLALMNFTGKP